jgi:hypothetical protein
MPIVWTELAHLVSNSIMIRWTDSKSREQMSRRSLVKAAPAVVIGVSSLGSSGGCGPELDKVLQIAFVVVELALVVGQLIKGELRITNPNDACRTYEVSLKLLRTLSGSDVQQASRYLMVCAGQTKEDLERFAGEHVLSAQMDGMTVMSPKFTVRT